MEKQDLNLLVGLLKVRDYTLLEVLGKYLREKYDTVEETTDYVLAIGNIPVMLVAHVDTVFPSPPVHVYRNATNMNLLFGDNGLGADDRAGVWAIMKILQHGLRPTVFFVTDEEIGALGTEKFIKNHRSPVTKLNYIIELDRRGTNDCVFYDCHNKKFTNYIQKFGWATAKGIFSDISVLCPAWGIAGVNLSVGYRNEHTPYETLDIAILEQNMLRVVDMLKKVNEKTPVYAYVGGMPLRFYTCKKCGAEHTSSSMIPLSPTDWYCFDCVEWCQKCGMPFLSDSDEPEPLCPACKEGLELDEQFSLTVSLPDDHPRDE